MALAATAVATTTMQLRTTTTTTNYLRVYGAILLSGCGVVGVSYDGATVVVTRCASTWSVPVDADVVAVADCAEDPWW